MWQGRTLLLQFFSHRLWTGRQLAHKVSRCNSWKLVQQRYADCTASSLVRGKQHLHTLAGPPQRMVCASSKPLATSCAKLLSYNLLPRACCKNLDTTLCSCLVLPQTLGLSGYRFLPYLCMAQHEVLGLASPCFHYDSINDFSNTEVALWLLSMATKPHKDRYTHSLPGLEVSWSLHQRCCCKLYHCRNRLASKNGQDLFS